MPPKKKQPDAALLDEELEANIDRMLEAAMGGLTPHELLLKASREEREDVEKRAAEIAKNRERALKLLAVLEKKLP